MNNREIHTPRADEWIRLSYYQRRGIHDFGLDLNQVQSENFGEHTLRSMYYLRQRGRAENLQQAFLQVQGLNRYQAHLVVQLGFNRNDVQAPDFGEHTIDAIYTLMNQGRYPNPYQALETVLGLNHFQTTGIVYFGLNREQVLTPNFGEHTMAGMRELRAQNRNLSDQQVFQLVQGLNRYQIRGMTLLRLTRPQVQSENFGEHTLNTMIRLLGQGRVQNPREAFELLQGLDRFQAWGINHYMLGREAVLSANFGRHTLTGLDELRFATNVHQNLEITYQEAFQRIRGLNEIQIRGIIEFNLNRQQVLNAGFGLGVLQTMQALQTLNINAGSEQLYNTAIQLPEYQVRAITVYGFIPQDLGLYFHGNQFVQFEREHTGIISGKMVDAIAHLIASEAMNRQQAYEVSRSLSSNQIIGMIDFGLNLEQVQSPLFASSQNVLSLLLDQIRGDEDEIDIPLLPDQQENARNIMDTMITAYSNLQSSAGIAAVSEAQSAAHEFDSHTLITALETGLYALPEISNPGPVNLSERSNSLEFLRYASNRDVLGIFDGINEIIGEDRSQFETISNSQDIEALEEQIVQSVMQATGVASMPTEGERSTSSSESANEGNLQAFKKPAFPTKNKSSKKGNTGNLKKPPPGADDDRKPSPKPKRRGQGR